MINRQRWILVSIKMIRLACIALFLAVAALASYGQDYKKFKDDSEVPRITVEDAKKAYDDNSTVIVDARAADIFKAEHIKGAINIPIGSSSAEFDKLPKGKKIIVYCS